VARILVVDDDARLREATRDILESEGHDVIEAKDGNAAVLAHRAQAVDVIVCDMFMPGQDGIETILVLRRESPEVKIIAVSGGGFSGAIDVLTMARHMGASEVLCKPFSGVQLMAAIERLLAPQKA
jgi:DNA-binding response OmpR family regulator